LTQAPQIFKDGRNSDHSSEEKKVEKLYQEIGQFQVELNWLKKDWIYLTDVRQVQLK